MGQPQTNGGYRNQCNHQVVARTASGGTGTCIEGAIEVHAPAGIPTDKGSYRFTVGHCAGMDVIYIVQNA